MHLRKYGFPLILLLTITLCNCGKRRTPVPNVVKAGFVQTGEASWYGQEYNGRKTASGETFNMHDYTAAHLTLPFGTVVRVENLNNHLSVVVRINDRGPFRRDRIIDLSYAAAKKINMLLTGVAPVKIVVLSGIGKPK